MGKTLVLTGAGSGLTIIDGGGTNAIMIDHSPGGSIENLMVQNGFKGILALHNSHAAIKQAVVQNCANCGIQIEANSNAEISDSTIDNNGHDGLGVILNAGIIITGTVTIKDNTRHGLFLFLG